MLYISLTIIFICLIGLIRTILAINNIKQRVSFTKEYAVKYSKFIALKEFDSQAYQWLLRRVDKMQDELGLTGVIDYQPPWQNYIMNNYHVLINTLPQIRERTAPLMLINGCQDVLIRHLGNLDEYINQMISRLKNPIRLFFEGVKSIVSIPIQIIYWSGLLSFQKYEKAYNGFIVKGLSFIVSLIMIISSILTIILGWEQFIILIKSFIVQQ